MLRRLALLSGGLGAGLFATYRGGVLAAYLRDYYPRWDVLPEWLAVPPFEQDVPVQLLLSGALLLFALGFLALKRVRAFVPVMLILLGMSVRALLSASFDAERLPPQGAGIVEGDVITLAMRLGRFLFSIPLGTLLLLGFLFAAVIGWRSLGKTLSGLTGVLAMMGLAFVLLTAGGDLNERYGATFAMCLVLGQALLLAVMYAAWSIAFMRFAFLIPNRIT
jgi:hypothetical protein